MKPTRANPEVDAFFEEATKWQEELRKLREIILSCDLIEELKWDQPFYTCQGGNVIVIWGFKAHCAIGFCKGTLLADPAGILVKPGANTQAVRKIPFTKVEEIVCLEATLKAYIEEAIQVEKAGLEVTYKGPAEFVLPEELINKFDENAAVKTAFEALSPGRQRGYILHFSAPKQSKTRASRIDKCIPAILEGRGLNDRP